MVQAESTDMMKELDSFKELKKHSRNFKKKWQKCNKIYKWGQISRILLIVIKDLDLSQ